MAAVTDPVATSVTLALRVRVTAPLEATVPGVHVPVVGSNLLAPASDERKVIPAGRVTVAATPVPWTGPLLVTVTLRVTTSPRLGLGRSMVVARARSTAGAGAGAGGAPPAGGGEDLSAGVRS